MRKITASPVLISFLSCCLLAGCVNIKPTYTKEQAAESIAGLCRKEYNIDVKAWLVGETVWVYMPLPRIFGKDLLIDKSQLEKVNKIMVSSSRVMLSMDPRPQFVVIVASDTREYGLDYTFITYIADILKLQNQFISREEFLRRNVIKLDNDHRALGDAEGSHINKKELSLDYFVCEQITQRIHQHFINEPQTKDKFKIDKVLSRFNGDILRVSYDIRLKDGQSSAVDILKDIKKIIAYVVSAYDLKNLFAVKIDNVMTQEEFLVSRVELRELLR
jgi:hypothetical protein